MFAVRSLIHDAKWSPRCMPNPASSRTRYSDLAFVRLKFICSRLYMPLYSTTRELAGDLLHRVDKVFNVDGKSLRSLFAASSCLQVPLKKTTFQRRRPSNIFSESFARLVVFGLI